MVVNCAILVLMKKLFSEIQGRPVFSRDTAGPVARIFDLVIDPANGTFVALSVHPSAAKIVGARDILSWYPHIVIRDMDSITEPDEVIKVHEVLSEASYGPFFKNSVVTESGEKLGRVFDYLINLDAGVVLNLMVAKTFLGLINFSERIIPVSDIIRVEPDQIIIKDDMRIPEGVREPEMMGA